MHDDFNLDYLSNSDQKQLLSVSLSTYNVLPMVNFPARLQNNRGTAIDNVSVETSTLNLCTVLSYIHTFHRSTNSVTTVRHENCQRKHITHKQNK